MSCTCCQIESPIDEDFTQRILQASGGRCLHGISFSHVFKNSTPPSQPLLRAPEYIKLQGPILKSTGKMTDSESAHTTTQIQQNSDNAEVATSRSFGVAVKGVGADTGIGNIQNNSSNTSKSKEGISNVENQMKTFTHYMASFRITISQMKLSHDVKEFGRTVNSIQRAQHFLRIYGSHVPDSDQHLGGKISTSMNAKKSSKAVSAEHNEHSSTVESQNVSFGVGLLHLTGLGVTSTETDTRAKDNQLKSSSKDDEENRDLTGDWEGPVADSKEDLIAKLNPTNWSLVERNMDSLVSVWDIIDRNHQCPILKRAAKFLRAAWLLEAIELTHHPIVSRLLDAALSEVPKSLTTSRYPARRSVASAVSNYCWVVPLSSLVLPVHAVELAPIAPPPLLDDEVVTPENDKDSVLAKGLRSLVTAAETISNAVIDYRVDWDSIKWGEEDSSMPTKVPTPGLLRRSTTVELPTKASTVVGSLVKVNLYGYGGWVSGVVTQVNAFRFPMHEETRAELMTHLGLGEGPGDVHRLFQALASSFALEPAPSRSCFHTCTSREAFGFHHRRNEAQFDRRPGLRAFAAVDIVLMSRAAHKILEPECPIPVLWTILNEFSSHFPIVLSDVERNCFMSVCAKCCWVLACKLDLNLLRYQKSPPTEDELQLQDMRAAVAAVEAVVRDENVHSDFGLLSQQLQKLEKCEAQLDLLSEAKRPDSLRPSVKMSAGFVLNASGSDTIQLKEFWILVKRVLERHGTASPIVAENGAIFVRLYFEGLENSFAKGAENIGTPSSLPSNGGRAAGATGAGAAGGGSNITESSTAAGAGKNQRPVNTNTANNPVRLRSYAESMRNLSHRMQSLSMIREDIVAAATDIFNDLVSKPFLKTRRAAKQLTQAVHTPESRVLLLCSAFEVFYRPPRVPALTDAPTQATAAPAKRSVLPTLQKSFMMSQWDTLRYQADVRTAIDNLQPRIEEMKRKIDEQTKSIKLREEAQLETEIAHILRLQIKLLQVSGEGSVAVTGQCLAAVRAMLRHWVQVSDDLLQSLSRRKETSDVSGFPHICMVVVRCLQTHGRHSASVAETGADVIRLLASNTAGGAEELGKAGACAVVVEMLKFHWASSDKVAMAACAALLALMNDEGEMHVPNRTILRDLYTDSLLETIIQHKQRGPDIDMLLAATTLGMIYLQPARSHPRSLSITESASKALGSLYADTSDEKTEKLMQQLTQAIDRGLDSIVLMQDLIFLPIWALQRIFIAMAERADKPDFRLWKNIWKSLEELSDKWAHAELVRQEQQQSDGRTEEELEQEKREQARDRKRNVVKVYF